MNRLLSSTMAVLLAATLHVNCGDKGTNPDSDLAAGTFEATISGAYNMTLKGCAAFVSLQDFFQLGLISLEPSAQSASISFARANSSIPGVRTYSVSEEAASSSPQDFVGVVFYSEGQNNETYISEAGSMTVSQSSSGGFSGSFNFTALAGTRKITVSGKFNAIPAPCR